MTFKEKLQAIRAQMSADGVDAYVIPSADPHISEYLPNHYKCISFATGFRGSVSTVVITQEFAGLWADSRYFEQAEEQLRDSGYELVKLKGIGRKSANVILRETHQRPEGILVDLHVLRVVPRFGLTPQYKDANKIEKILMKQLPYSMWNDIGMAFSFLGRTICRPTNPKCTICPIHTDCTYFKNNSNL